ncbi:Chitinase [Erwinia piriflorinigrans CFBP 5888]|uniref:chitinase n=1 Tax=Erwinia piriflorinigrans CFBP 5888 TaxID=1161919 RepID=V5Z5W3_9GAMM|nr:chitinase [Erwinia piriflorinigrans]CCG86317.1 Chitinase [Erwinia piriflorinigrans CFBP 5888]
MYGSKQPAELNPEVTATLKNHIDDAASDMPDMSGKQFIMGFWHNWAAEGSQGYQLGRFKEMNLTDIPEQYNIVAVAFMKGHNIPTFKPYNMTDEEFRRQVGVLNAQGRAVLISLGGADAEIVLVSGQEEALAVEIIRLVETYGFDGLDIDLEQSAIIAKDNQTVLPAALRLVKDHYRKEGKHFIISMAPEFPYLRTGSHYAAYISALEGYYDFIAPQFYNQGGDGLWIDETNEWLTQNNDNRKEDFLYYLTDSIINGTRGFIQIPNDKFAIGLPSNIDAAATGYVINPSDTLNALKRLEDGGQPVRGLMTWSVNWDAGFDKNGKSYDWEFIKRYGDMISGDGTISE